MKYKMDVYRVDLIGGPLDGGSIAVGKNAVEEGTFLLMQPTTKYCSLKAEIGEGIKRPLHKAVYEIEPNQMPGNIKAVYAHTTEVECDEY